MTADFNTPRFNADFPSFLQQKNVLKKDGLIWYAFGAFREITPTGRYCLN